MNGKDLLYGMNFVDDKFVEESEMVMLNKRKSLHWRSYLATVACFILVVVTAIFSSTFNIPTPQSDYEQPPVNSTEPNPNLPNVSDSYQISMSDIFINQFDGFADVEYSRYNPETDFETIWNIDDIVSYYGTDLLPAYIPNGLSASEKNAHATVYISQDGSVVEDTIFFNYYHDYYEDGNPKLTENIAATKGFSITISKLGIMESCYFLSENEIKTSDIDGIAVTFGYCSMPYGPYHSETHEPFGYYDMYVAEFAKDGIDFQIVAHQMEVEELVKVVASIIRGDANIKILQ